MDEMLQARRKLEIELRAAMMNGDLAVYYQPLVDLKTGKRLRLRSAAALEPRRARHGAAHAVRRRSPKTRA